MVIFLLIKMKLVFEMTFIYDEKKGIFL